MRTIAYSQDLRERVINLINEGLTRIEISKLLKISIPTIDRYIRKYKNTGNVNVKPFHNNKDKIKVHSNKIIDFVKQNHNATLKEIAKEMNVTFVTIHYILKKNGYSFKKKVGYTKKEMKS